MKNTPAESHSPHIQLSITYTLQPLGVKRIVSNGRTHHQLIQILPSRANVLHYQQIALRLSYNAMPTEDKHNSLLNSKHCSFIHLNFDLAPL